VTITANKSRNIKGDPLWAFAAISGPAANT